MPQSRDCAQPFIHTIRACYLIHDLTSCDRRNIIHRATNSIKPQNSSSELEDTTVQKNKTLPFAVIELAVSGNCQIVSKTGTDPIVFQLSRVAGEMHVQYALSYVASRLLNALEVRQQQHLCNEALIIYTFTSFVI